MLECMDLFSGAGGLSLGLSQAGLRIKVAIDRDADCEKTHKTNFPGTRFIRNDLADITLDDIGSTISDLNNFVLAGGPPCQPYSRLNRRSSHTTKDVRAYTRIVRLLRPNYVVFENVPALMKREDVWGYLLRSLTRSGYSVTHGILRAVDFGVPQNRERLIVIGSRHGNVKLPKGSGALMSVRDAIAHLPESSEVIHNHITMKLSDANLARIRSIGEGGKSKLNSNMFSDSYARMRWDATAPTITTKCISFSNGRFGHPEYDRAITVHEAAILQGFPETFRFVGGLLSCARQVGNAVPPPIARALGTTLVAHHRSLFHSAFKRPIGTLTR